MIVGEAHIIVRAITTGVRRDIKSAFKDVDDIGKDAGRNISRGLSRGMSGGGGGGGFFSSLASQAEGARAAFDALIASAYALGPGIALLLGAVGSLVGAFLGLVATTAGAVPSLIALVGVFAAVAAAAVTLKLAFMGVGEAIGAGLKAKDASGGAKAVAQDLTNYFRRIADAKEALRRVYEESNRAVNDAEKKLFKAQSDYYRTEEDNLEKLAEAKEKYERVVREGIENISDAQVRLQEVEARSARAISDSKARVQEAQENLNKAFEAGREEIQQLKFAAEGAVLSEKKAALELEKAREKLLRVQDVPPNSRVRKEAELAFAQADLNYRKAIDTNADMAKEQNRLNKEGVDGTAGVVDAKNKLASATQGQFDAEVEAANDVAEAKVRLARVERDAAEAAVEASRDRQKAAEDAADAEVAARERISAAEENLEQVIIKRLDSEYDAQQALIRAIEDLEKAQKKGAAAGAGAANAYANQLSKLSKEQRKFVRYMVDTFIPSIDKLRNAAAREFFPKLIPALENLRTNLFPALKPLLEETGSVLGDIAEQISGTLTSPAFLTGLEAIWGNINSTILPGLGNIGSNVILGITDVLEAAQPLTTRFVTYLDRITESFSKMFDTEAENKKLETFFNKAGSIAAEIGGIIGDFFSGIGTIIGSQMEPDSGGFIMLRFLRDGAAAFKAFTDTPEGLKRIEDFFKNTANNAKPILGFINDLVKELLKLGENPNIGKFFTTLKESDFVGTLGDIANVFADSGPAIAEFAASFAEFSRATLESEAINVFYKTFTAIFDALTKLFETPAVKAIAPVVASIAAAGVAMRLSWKLLKIPILGIIEPFTKLGTKLSKLRKDSVALKEAGKKLSVFGRLAVLGAGPLLLVTAIIVGVIAAFVAMWRESEIFREAIKKLIDGVITKAITIFETLKLKLEEALAPLGGTTGIVDGLKSAFKFLGDIIGTYVVPVLGVIIDIILNVLGAAIGFIIDALGFLIRAAVYAWPYIKEIVSGFVFWFQETVWPIINTVIGLIVEYFQLLWKATKVVWGIIYDVIKVVITWFQKIVWPIIKFVVGLIIGYFKFLVGIMKVVWETIFAVIGAVINWFKETAWPIIKTVVNLVINYFELLQGIFNTVWGFIFTAIDTVVTWFKGTAWPALKSAIDLISSKFTAVKDKILEVWGLIRARIDKVVNFVKNNIFPIFTSAFETVKDVIGTVWDKVKDVFDKIQTKVDKVVSKVKGFLTGMWSGLSSGLSAAFDVVKRVLNRLARGANNLIDGINFLNPLEDIPRFSDPLFPIGLAEGGIVPARRGGTLAVIGEAGRSERVEPLDQNGLSKRDIAMINMLSGGEGGGATINVYPSPGMDEVELASLISREISFMMRKGSV